MFERSLDVRQSKPHVDQLQLLGSHGRWWARSAAVVRAIAAPEPTTSATSWELAIFELFELRPGCIGCWSWCGWLVRSGGGSGGGLAGTSLCVLLGALPHVCGGGRREGGCRRQHNEREITPGVDNTQPIYHCTVLTVQDILAIARHDAAGVPDRDLAWVGACDAGAEGQQGVAL